MTAEKSKLSGVNTTDDPGGADDQGKELAMSGKSITIRRKQFCVLFLALIISLSACSGDKARITEAEMDIRSIRMALLRYAMQDGKYPTTEQGLQALLAKPTLPPIPAVWEGPYIDSEYLLDPWDNKYIYRSPSTEDPEFYKYDLYSCGPDGKEGGEDDISVRHIEKKLEQQ